MKLKWPWSYVSYCPLIWTPLNQHEEFLWSRPLSPSHTGLVTILLTIHDDKIRLIADKSLTNRAIGLRSRGDRTSKFGSSKVDGHAQNSGPAITNRKRSQTTHAWAYDQSCRVVPSITHAHGLTSRATGLATVTGQPCDWSCHLWNNFTTGSTIYYCQWRLVARP